jgi:hypothetical protein
MKMTKTWMPQTKRGENFDGWYASVSRANGHIFKIEGGFESQQDAQKWADKIAFSMASD